MPIYDVLKSMLGDVPDEDVTVFRQSKTASGDQIINVVRPNGTIASYEVQAPALYNALLQLDTGGLRMPSALSKASRTLVSLLTEKTPCSCFLTQSVILKTL